ncbi:MAG TPA: hypothetical protein VN032_02845 [Thermoanaerobaculia bacterium]|nr:hypothetical protein [Thermoanaerobaculia bacterium]
MALARAAAAERSERVFLAGGVVRDLLLGRPIRDVDLVIEGDAQAFARRLAARLGAQVRAHERFATATLLLPGGETLDVAATRRERYERPGALPTVEPGAPIEQDLGRRDFTVNAIALELGARARVLDPLGGREDLARGVVRALHDGSFRDDPTRALRAARYANRLGFRVEARTRDWLDAALEGGALDRISADRLRREVGLVLGEPGRSGAVALLQRLGIDGAIHPALRHRPGALARLRRAEALGETSSTSWFCYLLGWMGTASEADVRGVAARLEVSGAPLRRLLAWPRTSARFAPGLARRPRSEVRRGSEGLSPDELVAAAAGLGERDARALLTAAAPSSGAALSIGGKDLLAAGAPPGPAIGRALEETRAALEDGRIAAPEEALAFALRIARGGGA